jgi:hypothetical protein
VAALRPAPEAAALVGRGPVTLLAGDQVGVERAPLDTP